MLFFLVLLLIDIAGNVIFYIKTNEFDTSVFFFSIGLIIAFIPLIIKENLFIESGKFVSRLYKTLIVLALSSSIFVFGVFFLPKFSANTNINSYPHGSQPLKSYSASLSMLVYPQYLYRIIHFPPKIPEGSKNYYFYIDNSFHGYNIHYLSFQIYDEYLDEIIKKNESNIYLKINYSEIHKYYKYLSNRFDIFDTSKYDIYILQNYNEDSDYTSGFLISKYYHHIIYFYANFDCRNI